MTRAIYLGLLAAGAACGRPGGTTADSAGNPAPSIVAVDSVSQPVITLERTPCFGSCPVYRVSIGQDGSVRFVGKQHVAQTGMAAAAISRERVDSLVAELVAGGYFDFADRYLHDEPACGLYATDSPTVITSVTTGDRTKEIRHDYGCSATPPELGRLERRIDEVAGTARWTGR